ncbi:hypothetical protein FV139_11095 [Parahaliea maris]|uniref:HTH luxR-type domain-containing protein n=1 Tax=Parahaliea maris TaxID=2716870 RepID=A0A5C9A057_9GAMM|nr:helix-turn-helix transcriptional regulator [Parahaliea maris]TXS94138.1 hypothetical protein FV139_11095 [Parahaliea maris]
MGVSLVDQALLEDIYEGPLEELPWQGLVARIRQRFNVVGCSLYLSLPGPGECGLDVSDNDWDVEVLREHNARHYYRDNPFDYKEMQPGTVYRWTDFISREQFVETPYYREFCQPVGFDFALCLGIDEPGGMAIWLSVVRNEAQGDFSREEAQAFQALYAPMRRALRLLARIQHSETERQVYQTALEQMAIGALVLDTQARVVSCNATAQALIADCDEISIIGNRIKLQDVALQQVLAGHFEAVMAKADPTCEVMAIPRNSEPALGLLMRGLRGISTLSGPQQPALVVYLSDPARHQLAPRNLVAQLFGLTPTEATLATMLADGLSLAEAASAMHVSENSVRSYCKRIYSKTGLSRQGEVVKLVLQSVAGLARSPSSLHSQDPAPAGPRTVARR